MKFVLILSSLLVTIDYKVNGDPISNVIGSIKDKFIGPKVS